jgi:HK97 family phage prohead protease
MKPKPYAIAKERFKAAFALTEAKEGTFKGIASVFGSLVDAWIPTAFMPGAFTKTIRENGKRFRICYQHDLDHPLSRPGLGINAEDILQETSDGLLIGGKISQTACGKDVQTLLNDRVVDELSIGWDPIEGKYELMPINQAIQQGLLKFPEQWAGKNLDEQCRIIREARLWEASFVTFAADNRAVVTEAHAVVAFQDLPLADEDRAWDGAAAHNRMVEACDCKGESPDWAKFRKAHLWYDSDNSEKITGYKFLIADIIDGKMMAVPRGIFAAAGILQGARGGTKISEEEQQKMKAHLSRYYKKLNRTAPWDEEKDKKLLSDAIAAMKAILDAAEPPADDESSQGTSKQALTVNTERLSQLRDAELAFAQLQQL